MQSSFDNSQKFLLPPQNSKFMMSSHKQDSEKKEANSFFHMRNSRGTSPSASRKSTIIDEENSSPQNNMLRYQQMGKQKMGLKLAKQSLAVVKSEISILPSIDKQLQLSTKKVVLKQNHLKLKEEGTRSQVKKQQHSNKELVRKIQDSSSLIQQLAPPMIKKRKSSFANNKKYKKITLEQSVIDNVILYHEKNSFIDFYENDCTDSCYSKNQFTKTNTPTDECKLQNEWVQNKLRGQMLNWMIQVFRVLKVSSAQTYFLAVSILDRYCLKKVIKNQDIEKELLYLIGLSAIFMSSKYEDVIPIRMKQIIDDAGHQKFSLNQILKMERQILMGLDFNLAYNSLYEFASIGFKDTLFSYQKSKLPQDDQDEGQQFLLFLCQLLSFEPEIFIEADFKKVTVAVVNLTLKFLKRKFKYTSKHPHSEDQLEIQLGKKHYYTVKNLLIAYNNSVFENIETHFVQEVRHIENKIVNFYIETERKQSIRNLFKNFPKFMGEKAVPYCKKSVLQLSTIAPGVNFLKELVTHCRNNNE